MSILDINYFHTIFIAKLYNLVSTHRNCDLNTISKSKISINSFSETDLQWPVGEGHLGSFDLFGRLCFGSEGSSTFLANQQVGPALHLLCCASLFTKG